MSMQSISPEEFYGRDIRKLKELQKKIPEAKPVCERYVLKDILNGPSLIWRTFRKQDDALELQKLCKGGLMTFAFETSFGSGRQFLVAHPEVFWHYNSQRDIENRCTYEIIQENTASKIYLDLEFNKELNPSSDGDHMVDVLIEIIFLYLRRFFKIESSRKHILDLDSTNETKFSRHLIFNMPNFAFIDNKNVGNFIRKICQILKQPEVPQELADIDVQSLFVTDAKGKTVLFCDEGVYTKNRHFRCYKNSKRGKNCPLVLSKHNTFTCNNELEYFLSSLITNVKSHVKILQFSFDGEDHPIHPRRSINHSNESHTASPYPAVDKFINELVKPGKIYRSVYFSSSNTIVYDIVNNRFCGNIGREHKSNNVKYIVNIDSCTFYQKCHDWECRDYRSDEKPLPQDLAKQVRPDVISTESDELGLFGIFDEIAAEILDEIEQKAVKRVKLERFPSFGLSDEAFADIDLDQFQTNV